MQQSRKYNIQEKPNSQAKSSDVEQQLNGGGTKTL